MADKAMDTYLNDHLAGAMLGSELAEQIRVQNQDSALGERMGPIAAEIETDRQTLIGVMDRMGTSKNPIKQATTWIAEKASRPKFSGLTSGEPELGAFMALESLALGVQGKRCLWMALKEVAGDYPQLASIDLEDLIARAEAQHSTLEEERVSAAKRALGERTAK